MFSAIFHKNRRNSKVTECVGPQPRNHPRPMERELPRGFKGFTEGEPGKALIFSALKGSLGWIGTQSDFSAFLCCNFIAC